MTDPVLLYAASAALACVLPLGALEKLKDMAAFAAAVQAYEIVLAALGGLFAWGYVLAEALATAEVAVNLARGRRDIDCGCGGPAMRGAAARGVGLSWWMVARNALLALWTLPVFAAAQGASRSLQWADAAPVFSLAMSAVPCISPPIICWPRT